MEEQVAESFNHLSVILKRGEKEGEGNDKKEEEEEEEEEDHLLSVVSKGIQGLYFHCSDEFVRAALSLCLKL